MLEEIRYEEAVLAARRIARLGGDGSESENARRLARIVYAVLAAIYASERRLNGLPSLENDLEKS